MLQRLLFFDSLFLSDLITINILIYSIYYITLYNIFHFLYGSLLSEIKRSMQTCMHTYTSIDMVRALVVTLYS